MYEWDSVAFGSMAVEGGGEGRMLNSGLSSGLRSFLGTKPSKAKRSSIYGQ